MATSPTRKGRPLALVLTVAVLARLVLNTARRFPYPFASVLQRGLGVPLAAVTSLIAVSQATAFFSPLFGPVGDRFGHRVLFLAGTGFLSVGMLASAALPIYGAVLVGIFLAGLGKSVFDPAVQAYVGERVPYARRGLAIGLVELAWSGATLMGIPAVGLLISVWGWRSPFLVLGLLGLAATAALALVLPKERPAPAARPSGGRNREWRALIRHRPALAGLALGFLISAANDNVFVVYGAWLEGAFGLGVAALGVATTAIGAAEVGGELLTATASDRVGLRRALGLGLLASAAGYALLPLLGQTLFGALFGLFFAFLAFEFSIVTSFSLLTEVLPGARTTMLSAYVAALGAGRVAGALTGGALWAGGGIGGTGLLSAALTLLAWSCLHRGLGGWVPTPTEEGPASLPPLE